jgi:peptidoglycan/LPS O-acetylase OafA/YrhL
MSKADPNAQLAGVPSGHFASIDALRGLAIIGVVAAHSRDLFAFLPSLADALAKLGSCGVQLFFVLSAFTLMNSWAGRHDGAARFYLRRLFRIVPMFWLATGVYFGLDRLLGTPFWLGGVVDARSVLLTLLFSHGWSAGTINAIVPGGWSIAVEMNFYLLFPLLAVAATGLTRSVLMLVAALLLAIGANSAAALLLPAGPLFEDFIYYWLPNALPAFMIGLVAFHLRDRAPRRWPAATGLALLAAWLAVAVARGLLPWASSLAQPISRGTAIAVAGLLLILALYRLPVRAWLSRLLVNRAMVRLGQISFSVYLLHFMVIEALRRTIGPLTLPTRVADLAWLASLPVLVGLSALPALLTYRWIEQPGIRAGGRLLRRIGRA